MSFELTHFFLCLSCEHEEYFTEKIFNENPSWKKCPVCKGENTRIGLRKKRGRKNVSIKNKIDVKNGPWADLKTKFRRD